MSNATLACGVSPGSTGSGSSGLRPSGVALITSRHSRGAADPMPRSAIQRVNAPGALGRARRDRHPHAAPAGGDRGGPGASAGADDEPRRGRRLQRLHGAQQPFDVGVAPRHDILLSPEDVAGADLRGLVQPAVHRERGGFLVRNGDVPAPAGTSQRAHQRGDIVGGTAQGHVDRAQSERAERGVLHGGRQGVRDRVAEQGEDPGVAVDHRTMPATRLTTWPTSSCSSPKVAR